MDRIENDELREAYRKMGCQLCPSWNLVSGHHIKTRGAGGHDIPENLIALCFQCHTKIHMYGLNKMIRMLPKLLPIISEKGWYRQKIGTGENEIEKWFNDVTRPT